MLIAPDSFGDSLTAVAAAEAIAAGWAGSRPGDELTLAPQSDGGPGFVDVLATRLGRRQCARVRGPVTGEVDAQWLLDAVGGTAYLECAQACGLALLDGPPTPQTALAGSTYGVGQLIAAALDAGAGRIVVGLGGSATTDGGRGMVGALAPDGSPATARRRVAGVELIAASDVEHRLLGPMGAAAVFGPQKGADPPTVALLEDRLRRWGAELDAAAGRAVAELPGAGAAGGLGAALLALGAHRESGAAVIAGHTGLAADIAAADVVVTGEGRLDHQSLHGKVVGALAAAARDGRARVLVLAGQVALSPEELTAAGITAARSLTDHAGSVATAMADARHQLESLAAVTAAQVGNSDPSGYR